MSVENAMTQAECDVAEPAKATPETVRQKAHAVEANERVASVDVIRGVALLGILAMNIVSFAWPEGVYSIPILAPGSGPIDVGLWAFNHLFFDTKMMTLFSMLFGAGLVLMSSRAEERGAKILGVYYRRVAWLLVIGLVHACLIWSGDILVMYALCGFVLYPFRKLRPRTLIITGIVFNLLLVLVLVGFRLVGIPYIQATAQRVDARALAHQESGWWDQSVHDFWKKASDGKPPTRAEILGQIHDQREPYWNLVKRRAQGVIWEPLAFVLGAWWLAGGRMLIGMGFMKLGVFAAALERRTYVKMMLLGYGIGIPLMLGDAFHEIVHNFHLGNRLWHALDGWPLLTFYGSLPVVVGHIGLVMYVFQTGAVPWLTRRLAAVGRMALSHYLLTSLFCTTLFYGYGFDYFGTIQRPLLYAIVLLIWTFQLLVSPLWLRVFRFGPAEWLWRSLTYWKVQPIFNRAK
jgi:uncharacterized protein